MRNELHLSRKIIFFVILLHSCAGQKVVVQNNDNRHVDEIIEQLKITGWADNAIEIYSQTGFKEYLFSEEDKKLYHIPKWAGDTVQEVWYDLEQETLFERTWGKEQTRTCSRTGDLRNRFCVTCNSHNDTLKIERYTINIDNVVHLEERVEYDYKGDLKTHLVQSDSLYLDATFYKTGMPLRYDARYRDSMVYIDDSTSILYWRHERITGEVYGVNGFEYLAGKITMNKMTINRRDINPKTVSVGVHKEYRLYSDDLETSPVSYLSREGEYDFDGNRVGVWREYDASGQVINEISY